MVSLACVTVAGRLWRTSWYGNHEKRSTRWAIIKTSNAISSDLLVEGSRGGNRAQAGTISRVQSGTVSGTVTFNIEKRFTRAGTPTDVMSADLEADATDQSSCAAGCAVNTITSGSFGVGWLVLKPSAVSSPVGFGACVVYLYN